MRAIPDRFLRKGARRWINRSIKIARNEGMLEWGLPLFGAAQYVTNIAAQRVKIPWTTAEYKAAMQYSAQRLESYYPTNKGSDRNGLHHEDKAILE